MHAGSTRGVVVPFPRRTANPDSTCAEVLFVCEDRALGAAVTRLLAHDGFHVRAVAHSGHAMLACRTGRVDVLIADLWANDMSGPELADRMRRHYPALRAVFLAEKNEESGGENVLARPFSREDLVARLKALPLTVSSAS